jgi:hypothetical protein
MTGGSSKGVERAIAAGNRPPTPSMGIHSWDKLRDEWLRSGKSKKAFIIEKVGYFGGQAIRKTRDWAPILIEAVRAQGGTANMDLVRTFVAQFAHAYVERELTVDNLFMGVPNLGPAEMSLRARAAADAQRKPTIKPEVVAPQATVPTVKPPSEKKSEPRPQIAKPRAEAPGWATDGPSLAQATGTPVAPAAVSETNHSLNVEHAEDRSQMPGQIESQPTEPPAPTTGVAPSNKGLAVWDQVQDWRANQAVVDWRTAERVRNHITMLTAQHVTEVPALNPDGTPKLDSLGRPKTKLVSTLTPVQVRQLAEATGAVQRAQRLAIGLSTDNIGIDIPRSAGDTPNVAQPTQDEAPLFIVEMTQNGKFVRQRPTRVR